MGMCETFCRTSGSDVMSFHFSKQGLIEPALNFFTFFSRNCFKRLKWYTSNISFKFNVLFSNCFLFGLDNSEKFCLVFVGLVDNLGSLAHILESSSGTWKRTWSLTTLLSIFSYLNFLYFNKEFNLFFFCRFSTDSDTESLNNRPDYFFWRFCIFRKLWRQGWLNQIPSKLIDGLTFLPC